jgi:uncharacterized DUF497 family protein
VSARRLTLFDMQEEIILNWDIVSLNYSSYNNQRWPNMLLFEWDTHKARKNEVIHGVSFDEASTAFRDTLSLTIHDPLHSDEEDRFILIGNSASNRLLVVVHTEREQNIRIISARKATKKERKQYEENAQRSRHA